MTPLLIVISMMIAYFAVLAASMWLSQPVRLRLVALASDMLDDDRSKAEQDELNWLMDSSTSTIVGMMIPVAAVWMLALAILGGRPRLREADQRLMRDKRYDELSWRYVVSVAACSPFASLLAAPFVLAALMILAIRGDRELIRAAESPVMKASAAFQPC